MKYREAIAQATYELMRDDPSVVVLGEGVADPKGIFGTTKLAHEHFPDRVIETPLSENMLTGALAGMASGGLRPIYVHARAEFSLLGMEHIVNTIAKWPWLHNGQQLPIVIRMLVGRGWGQGPTHSQSFHGMFAQVPGLRVFYPVWPKTVGMGMKHLMAAGQPGIIIEPRRLYDKHEDSIDWPVYVNPDVFLVTIGDIVLDAIAASDRLRNMRIHAEVVPIQDMNEHYWDSYQRLCFKGIPIVICESVPGWQGGIGYDIAAWAEQDYNIVCPPNEPCPTAYDKEQAWYPSPEDIVKAACELLGREYVPEENLAVSVPERDGRREPF